MKRIVWSPLVALIFLVSVTTGIAAENQQWEETFFAANQAYKEGRFQDAVDGYNQLIRSGHPGGHIYYNLGNACFRLNQFGLAILNYERARLLIPRNADLNFNLGHARDQIRDAISESHGLISTTFFWLDSLSLDELFVGFAILNVLFWGILLLRLFFRFFRSEGVYYLLLVVLLCWFIAGASFGVKWYQVKTDDRAVILAGEASILAGPDSRDTLLFKLHEGAIVHVERSEDGWSLVRLPDGKRGWVRDDAMEHILSSGISFQEVRNALQPEGLCPRRPVPPPRQTYIPRADLPVRAYYSWVMPGIFGVGV